MTTVYPAGYGTTELDLDDLEDRFGTGMHPEFRRRLFAMLEAADGLVGIGGGWRSTETQAANYARAPQTFAPPGSSFHESHTFASGIVGYQAVDTVGTDLDADGTREAAEHAAAWAWLDANAHRFGLKTFRNVNNEPWHVQCADLPNSVRAWKAAGRPDPTEWDLPGDDDYAPPSTANPPQEPPAQPHTRRLYTVNVSLPTLSRTSPADKQTAMMQAVLNAKSGAGLVVDGKFGAKTEQAVRNWQAWHHLTVDGWCGPKTWAHLLEAH